MADLVTRLRLDDKQFNDNIQKSKKQLSGFSQAGVNVTDTFKNMIGSVGKIGGAIGIATGAGEAFNKMMQTSQTFGDKMTASIEAAKGGVNEFFYALGTGDFSSFISGLDGVISKAKDTAAALDQLGNTRMSYTFVRGESRRKIADAKTIANNADVGRAEREAAFDVWEAGLEEAKQNAVVLEGEIQNAVKKLSEEDTQLQNVSIEAIKKVARLDVMNPESRTAEKDALGEKYNEYVKAQAKLAHGERASMVVNGKILSYKEQQAKLADKYSDAILYNNLLVRKNDEEWQNIISMLIEAADATEELGSQFEEYNNARRVFNTESVKPIKASDILPAGSIKEIEKKIGEIKGKIGVSVDPKSRAELYRELKALEEKKRVIEFMYKYPTGPGKVEGKKGGLAALAKKPGDLKPYDKKDIKINNDYADSLSNIASAMGSISSMTKDGASAWLTWGANLLSAVASAIPAITALIGVKKTEAVVNGVKSASETPVTGWLMAAAGGAAVLAALAAIPAFAGGGVVPGVMTAGDKNLARVNAGEMILNRGQQANLFNLLDKGGLNGGNVTFRIQGKELVGVIDNYTKQKGRLR